MKKLFLIIFCLLSLSSVSFASECDYIYEDIFAFKENPTPKKQSELTKMIKDSAYIQVRTYDFLYLAKMQAPGQNQDYINSLDLLNSEGRCIVQAVSDLLLPIRLTPANPAIVKYAAWLEKNDRAKPAKDENLTQTRIRKESYVIQAQLKLLSYL